MPPMSGAEMSRQLVDGTFLPVHTPPAPALWSPEWWAEFLKSPGVGGIAAVIAAVITLVLALTARRIERHRAEQDRKTSARLERHARTREAQLTASEERRYEAEAWWEHYWRVREHLATIDPESALSLLEVLARTAPDDLASALVVVDMKAYAGDDEGGDGR